MKKAIVGSNPTGGQSVPLKRNGLRAEIELGRRPQNQDQAVAPKIIISRAREIDRELILAGGAGSNPVEGSNKLHALVVQRKHIGTLK